MKDYVKTMRECNQQVADIMHKFSKALMEMVRAHDGFLITKSADKDNVYGYALDDDDVLNEYDLLALRINKGEDGGEWLECFLAPHFGSVKITYTKEDMLSEDCADQWYCLDGGDGALYSWATLVDMMGIIDEFDE